MSNLPTTWNPLEIGADGFVGRLGDLRRLSDLAEAGRPILIHGPGGVGKTSLAKAFGRVLGVGGRLDPRGAVHYVALDPSMTSSGVDALVTRLGVAIVGTSFEGEHPEARRDALLAGLASGRHLLILDGLDAALSMDLSGDDDSYYDDLGVEEPGEPEIAQDEDAPDPLDVLPEPGSTRAELRDLVERWAAEGTIVVVTAASPVTWLGRSVERLELAGLEGADAAALVDRLLNRLEGDDGLRDDEEFPRLLDELGGNPLAMRCLLRHASKGAGKLLGALGAVHENEGGGVAEVAARHAYLQLLPQDQKRLKALAFFEDEVELSVLARLSDVSDEEGLVPYQGIRPEAWKETLLAAERVALIEPERSLVWRIHPVVRRLLRARWQEEHGRAFLPEEHQSRYAWIMGMAGLLDSLLERAADPDESPVGAQFERHRGNFNKAVALAFAKEHWGVGRRLVEGLDRWWRLLGLRPEEDALRCWVLEATTKPEAGVPDLTSRPGGLWLAAMAARAKRQLEDGDAEAAEAICDRIRNATDGSTQGAAWSQLAALYKELGEIEEARSGEKAAQRWYKQSLDGFVHSVFPSIFSRVDAMKRGDRG